MAKLDKNTIAKIELVVDLISEGTHPVDAIDAVKDSFQGDFINMIST